MESETLIVGGSLGTAAVSAVIYAFKVLLKRAIDQMDAAIKENTNETRALRDELRSLKNDVYENNAQVIRLSSEIGSLKQRVDQHDNKFDGLRSYSKEEFLELRKMQLEIVERLVRLEVAK